jgi:hypothetical protein
MTAGSSMPATIRIVSPQAGLVIYPTIRLRFCAQVVGAPVLRRTRAFKTRPVYHRRSAGRPIRAQGALLREPGFVVGARLARESFARSAAVGKAFSAGGALVIIRRPVSSGAFSTDCTLS